MRPTSRIDIDLTALDDNLAAWRASLGNAVAVCPVVKADAYGLGAVPVTRRLVQKGVDTVAVYSAEQAAEVADAIGTAQILVLMPFEGTDPPRPLRSLMSEGRIHLTVHSFDHLDQLDSLGRQLASPISVQIELDTGLCRGGMDIDQARKTIESLSLRKWVKLTGMFSHAACPDTDAHQTLGQLRRLETLYSEYAERFDRDFRLHFAGTIAALRGRRFHQSMVRLGRGLYGYGLEEPFDTPGLEPVPELRPALRWVSRVVHVKEVPSGTPIGYHGSFVTGRTTRIGLVPVGHADGYPQALGNKGVLRAGPALRHTSVIGEINMDQLLIDLTDIPHAANGLEVELIANEANAPNSLPRIAGAAGTSVYELMCRISPRIPRRYLHGQSTGITVPSSVSAARIVGV